jgi:NAD(P)-dependent dehydrogenase (short-subunit alcohol dehydrogenase family)
MQISQRVVVVTGAGSGIGRALAQRCAREGAAAVVMADIDGARAARVADTLETPAIGTACDVTDESQLAALIEQTEDTFGPIDLYFANAGIADGAGLNTPDDVWQHVLDVNVMAHVHAARHLVPRWLQRGGGYFVVTASAAGLLTQIGAAPYSVSKHAAVGFAEWLAITYGAQGIRVSCICPMMVNTPMLTGHDVDDPAREQMLRALSNVLEPDDVADAVIAGVRDERFLILPHEDVLIHARRRADDHQRWLAGMQRLQAKVAGDITAPNATLLPQHR